MFGLKQHDHEIFYHQDHLVFKRTPPRPPSLPSNQRRGSTVCFLFSFLQTLS